MVSAMEHGREFKEPRGVIPLLVLATLLFSTAFAVPARAESPPIPVRRERLANGLRVVLAADASLGDVTVVVRYGVGSSDDPDGLEGLAHMVEHLQFAGSRHVLDGDHFRLLEAAGGTRFVGQTGSDATTYAETIPPEALQLALWLEGDRMRYPCDSLSEARLERERAIVVAEHESKVLDSPFALASVVLLDSIYPEWHPYHLPLDWNGAPSNIHLRDVRAFLRSWYTPSNAALIVVGPFDDRVASTYIDEYFGAIPARSPPIRPALASWTVGDLLVDATGHFVHRAVMAAWSTPSLREPGDRELDVAATLLAGSNGTLVRSLVESGLAAGVEARQISRARGSFFEIGAAVDEVKSIVPLGAAIESALAELARGPDELAVARIVKQWDDRAFLGLETSHGRASRLAGTLDLADPWDLEGYRGITGADVAQAVRRFLVPQSRAALVVYPAATPRPEGVRLVIERSERRNP
jgi:zinc protease